MAISTELGIYTWSAVDNVVRKETIATFRVFVNTHFMSNTPCYYTSGGDVYIYRRALGADIALCTTAGSIEQAHDRFKPNSQYAKATFGEVA